MTRPLLVALGWCMAFVPYGLPVQIPSAWAQESSPAPPSTLSPLQRIRQRLPSPTPSPAPVIYKTPSAILTPPSSDPPAPAVPPHSELGLSLEDLPLMPHRDLALRMDGVFRQKVQLLNYRIQQRQRQLHLLLEDWTTDPDEIRQIQAGLSELRTERDRLALEHLLLMRQLERHFVIPPSSSPSPSPLPQEAQE